MASKSERGLVIIYTGEGKGKTTAALGLTLRAVGRGKRVAIVQFIKGAWKVGEQEAIKRLAPHAELTSCGMGFVGILNDDRPREAHVQAAQETLQLAREKMQSGQFDILILDEANVAVDLKLISEKELLDFIKEKPADMDLVLTGRGATDALIEIADLVTEMKEVKHPFNKGLPARPGIDF